MRSIAGFIIRTSAFVSKELEEILRQTRLLLVLVLGPFLILLLFGLGYKNEARVLRTAFVVPPNQPQIAQQVQQYATSLGAQLQFAGIVPTEAQGLAELTSGKVDAVVVIPSDVEQSIKNSQQAMIKVYHHEIDPFQVSYVQYVAQIYVDEVNRRVLLNVAQQGQQQAGKVQQDLQTAKASAHAMRQAFEAGNASEAQAQRGKMNQSMDAVTLGLGASLSLLQGVEQSMGPIPNTGGTGAGGGVSASQIMGTLQSYNSSNSSLQNTPSGQSSYSQEAQRSAQIEQDLNQLDNQITTFRKIDPRVLVNPFAAKAVNVNNLTLTSSDFFSPGVIILLLQHLLITFAALSIVRERTMGTMELFRVAPITSFETLLGKYLSYFVIGSVLAAAISALVVFALHVPMLGNWGNFAAVLAAVMFASLGIGFVISLISETTSQAVQFSMLVLLFSIFFSGFLLDLRLMQAGVRVLAWIIPATYGMQMLQSIMFRANPIDFLMMAGLLGIGLAMFILAWVLLNRQMRLR